jgi:hypothetical protein
VTAADTSSGCRTNRNSAAFVIKEPIIKANHDLDSCILHVQFAVNLDTSLRVRDLSGQVSKLTQVVDTTMGDLGQLLNIACPDRKVCPAHKRFSVSL